MESLLWYLLEGGVALCAAIFIVWWTWPRGGSGDTRHKAPPDRE